MYLRSPACVRPRAVVSRHVLEQSNSTLHLIKEISGGIRFIKTEPLVNQSMFSATPNAIQVYTLPLQHAIDAAISKTTSGPNLGRCLLNTPFTIVTEAEKQQASTLFYEQLVTEVLGFAFFIGLCGVTYHLTGHITRQREQGMLQLIDAMMPNKKRWQCLIARGIASHLAFDIIYAPGWIVMGGVTSVLAFPATNPGWIILIYFLGWDLTDWILSPC